MGIKDKEKVPDALGGSTGTGVATTGASALPAYLAGTTAAVLDGTDASDFIMPRLKLLQAIDPIVESFDDAKTGMFWHSALGEPIGYAFDFIVCSFRKKYLLMAPMGDPRKVMARAEDGVHWSPPDGEFKVKLKGVRDEQCWRTAPTVRESGLAEYGSSVAGDNDSKPAAVLIYEYLVYLPEHPAMSPVVMSLARSQIKRGKDLNTKISLRGAPLQSMRFSATSVEETGQEGPYRNFQFVSKGYASEPEYKRCLEIAEKFGSYKVADEEQLATEGEVAASGKAKTEDY